MEQWAWRPEVKPGDPLHTVALMVRNVRGGADEMAGVSGACGGNPGNLMKGPKFSFHRNDPDSSPQLYTPESSSGSTPVAPSQLPPPPPPPSSPAPAKAKAKRKHTTPPAATPPGKKSHSDPSDDNDPIPSVLLQIRDSIGKLENRVSTLEKNSPSPSTYSAPPTDHHTVNVSSCIDLSPLHSLASALPAPPNRSPFISPAAANPHNLRNQIISDEIPICLDLITGHHLISKNLKANECSHLLINDSLEKDQRLCVQCKDS
ncbi:hypothetical protein DPX16_6707 [Anabarilius grahami]|uniref:Uncharacterized protein n=1 Tax=Anabarilius grahami TaxID=495550 RepID=A0A3N0YEU8_ANAGA|nr:hypothetical protein DPX16_6707 [Anabarilius grahami]